MNTTSWLHAYAAWLIVFFTVGTHCFAEIPEVLLKQLSSDDFKARQSAEEDLAVWAFDNREVAYDKLYQHAKEHPVAEIRVRCLSVLRQLVNDIYDSEGEGYVGIRMQDVTMRLPDQRKPVAVLEIVEVVADSPASKGGLLVGDVILSLEQEEWKSLPASEDFRNRVKSFKPRSEINLKVLREKEIIEIKVRLARRPAALEQIFEMPGQQRVDAMEKELREEHFKKWLLDRRNDR